MFSSLSRISSGRLSIARATSCSNCCVSIVRLSLLLAV
jgi:hypothetical protein